MTVSAAAPQTERPAGLIERLVGETAEPAKVVAAAKAIGERALPMLAKSLFELAGAPLQVELETVDLGRMSDAFLVEGETEPLAIAASANSPDALLLSLDTAGLSMFIGLTFGAGPESQPAPIDRPLSRIDRQVTGHVFRSIAESLNGSGQRALDIRFPLPQPIAGEDRRRQVHRDGPSARLTYRVSTPGGSGCVFVTMPQRIVLTRRGGEEIAAGPAKEWKARFSGEVMRSRVMLKATMSLGRLTLGEISALRPGQVLELSAAAPGEARLSARDNALFVCEFGKLGQNYTVRIKQPVDPEQELISGLMPATAVHAGVEL